jgi:hypothetical protein
MERLTRGERKGDSGGDDEEVGEEEGEAAVEDSPRGVKGGFEFFEVVADLGESSVFGDVGVRGVFGKCSLVSECAFLGVFGKFSLVAEVALRGVLVKFSLLALSERVKRRGVLALSELRGVGTAVSERLRESERVPRCECEGGMEADAESGFAVIYRNK